MQQEVAGGELRRGKKKRWQVRDTQNLKDFPETKACLERMTEFFLVPLIFRYLSSLDSLNGYFCTGIQRLKIQSSTHRLTRDKNTNLAFVCVCVEDKRKKYFQN